MDYFSIDGRKLCLQEILGQENVLRKTKSFKELEIYKNKQKEYIYRELLDTVSAQTFKEMRKFGSINLSRKVVNSLASIYKDSPERVFENATDREIDALNELYKSMQVNIKLKKANRYYKLHNQVCLQILPKKNKLYLKVLSPHHYDVIPDPEMPDGEPLAYILSGFDASLEKSRSASAMRLGNVSGYSTYESYYDSLNQKIGDREDYKSKVNYFVWWTREHHFVTDREGNFIFQDGSIGMGLDIDEYKNPIAPNLPFVDIVVDRDFEYWLDSGSNITDFQVDMGIELSDMSDISWRQGYSQAVISATEMPQQTGIGPHTVLFLKQDPQRSENQPQFQFASPSPDLGNSLELMKAKLNMWLSSLSEDTSIITTSDSGAKTFSSAIERVIANIEKFEASRDDMDLFKDVESKILELIIKWNNILQSDSEYNLKFGKLSENIKVKVNYKRPEMMQTKDEKEASVIRRLENGLISYKNALMELYEVNEDEALKVMSDIKKEQSLDEVEDLDGNRQIDEAEENI